MYNGKNAPFETRKIGSRLAHELWNSGWNYIGCSINPVYGSNKNMKSSSRPEWTVLGRINSCMETILFREKFLDWPDKTRVIGTRAGDKAEIQTRFSGTKILAFCITFFENLSFPENFI